MTFSSVGSSLSQSDCSPSAGNVPANDVGVSSQFESSQFSSEVLVTQVKKKKKTTKILDRGERWFQPAASRSFSINGRVALPGDAL